MLTSLIPVAAAAMMPPSSPQEPLTDCSYDLEAMLALDLEAFDQDLNGGWRVLDRKGCVLEAAELIREWRFHKRAYVRILYWHEGQLRANAGQTDQAIALFNLTYKSINEDQFFGWNHYVDGTIAFLQRDRDRLSRAIDRLAAVKEPTDSPKTFTMSDGTVIQLSWPPNLKVLQAFERCWERDYKEAYNEPSCREDIG